MRRLDLILLPVVPPAASLTALPAAGCSVYAVRRVVQADAAAAGTATVAPSLGEVAHLTGHLAAVEARTSSLDASAGKGGGGGRQRRRLRAGRWDQSKGAGEARAVEDGRDNAGGSRREGWARLHDGLFLCCRLRGDGREPRGRQGGRRCWWPDRVAVDPLILCCLAWCAAERRPSNPLLRDEEVGRGGKGGGPVEVEQRIVVTTRQRRHDGIHTTLLVDGASHATGRRADGRAVWRAGRPTQHRPRSNRGLGDDLS